MSGTILKNRYIQVEITNDGGERVKASVHRLVCLSFHGEAPSEQHHAAHGDGDRSNNSETNLRWATAKENDEDQWRHGRHPFGETAPTAKLSTAAVIEIRAIGRSRKQRDLASEFKISQRQIGRILNGQSRRHEVAAR